MSKENWIEPYECMDNWGYHLWLPLYDTATHSVVFCSRCATKSSIDTCIGCKKSIDPLDTDFDRDTIYVWHTLCA